MTSTVESLKNEISECYIKDLKKELLKEQYWLLKYIAVLTIKKPIKDALTWKLELPKQFNQVKEFWHWKDIINFMSPDLANQIFEFMKSKRMEIEKRKTESELIQLREETLWWNSENVDSNQSQNPPQTDISTDWMEWIIDDWELSWSNIWNSSDDWNNQNLNQKSQEDDWNNWVVEWNNDKWEWNLNSTWDSNKNSDKQEKSPEYQNGDWVNWVAAWTETAFVFWWTLLSIDKITAAKAIPVEQLDATNMKSTILEIINITKEKRNALEHRLTTNELRRFNKNMRYLEASIHNINSQAIDVLNKWNKLGSKLNISRAILEQCGLSAGDLSLIWKNADLIFKSKDNIGNVRVVLQEMWIKSIDDSIVESLCKAWSANEIKAMTDVLRNGNKVSRMLQTLSSALWIDAAFIWLDVWFYIEQNKEAELISKLNKIRWENKRDQAKRQLWIWTSSVLIQGLIIWMMGGSAAWWPVWALVGLAAWSLAAVTSVWVDSLYFDVADFYSQNQEDYLRQSRSKLKQAILQWIHNKKQWNESINEMITSFISPSLKPWSELKEKSLNDACVSMIFLEEISEYGQFAYNNSLWDYVRSSKSKEDFLSDKDQNYKNVFEETRHKLEDRINTRMQYVSKEFEKPDIIESLNNWTWMQDLTDIFTNSRIFADLKESWKWDDSISFDENLNNYKSELLSNFPAEKIQKFESIKQNNPSLFQEIISTVSLDSFIYWEWEDWEDDNNYVQNVKMVAAYQNILKLTQSIENKKYLNIDNVKNSRFVENLLRSDFDLNKVEYPTLKPETVVNIINLNCERKWLTDISDNPLQNILYKLARELFWYSEENDMRGLMWFFSESNANNQGIYYSGKWKINKDWAIDANLDCKLPQILHEKDVDKYVEEFIYSNFYSPVYDEEGKLVWYSSKGSIDTPTESIDDELNNEFRTKIISIIREELSNHSVENQERIKNQISNFVKQHSNWEYIELPYFLILEAKKAWLWDLQRQYFKWGNNKLEICYIPSELHQKSIFIDCEKSFITQIRENFTVEEQYYVERVDKAYEKLGNILNEDLWLPSDLHSIIEAKKLERNKFKEDALLYGISVVKNQGIIDKYKEYAEYFENLYRWILMSIGWFQISNDIDNINYYRMAMRYWNVNLFDNKWNLLEWCDGDELWKQNEFKSFYNEQIEKLKIWGKTIKELWCSENEKEKELAHRASNFIYTTVLEYALIDTGWVIHAWNTITERQSTSSSMYYIMSRYYKHWNPWLVKDEDKINRIIKTIEDKFKGMKILPELDDEKITDLMKKQTIQKLTKWENKVTNITPQVQNNIEITWKDISWKWKRWNIEYDPWRRVIKSRWKEVEVISLTDDGIKLTWLDLNLTLEEWTWLANFKNWVKYSYWDKKVKYTRWIFNRNFSFRNTFYVGNTMLITRWDLEKYCPACKSDEVAKKIWEWLN